MQSVESTSSTPQRVHLRWILLGAVLLGPFMAGAVTSITLKRRGIINHKYWIVGLVLTMAQFGLSYVAKINVTTLRAEEFMVAVTAAFWMASDARKRYDPPEESQPKAKRR